jgi:Reverse transcriptase (RNA-dependent DNA polymerase)
VDEWIVTMIQSMYAGASTSVRFSSGKSDSFEVKVGVHQESVLSPLLFIIVMEALSSGFRE